jgi:NADH:ubiquinone oxidoreductase subunit 2 (subunit N)
MKFFLIQAFSSLLFVMWGYLNFGINAMEFTTIHNSYLGLIGPIWVKIGLFPTHEWFLSMLKDSLLEIFLILRTIQKIAPLLLVIVIFPLFNQLGFIVFLIITITFLLLKFITNKNFLFFLFFSRTYHIIIIIFLIVFQTGVDC